MKAPFKSRISRVKSSLKKNSMSSALLISSNPLITNSADSHFPYRPNSDLFYLTGLRAQNLILLIRSGKEAPLLIQPPPDKLKEVWENSPENIKLAADRIDADLITDKNPLNKALEHLKDIELLYFENTPGTLSNRISNQLLSKSVHTRGRLPAQFAHSDKLLSPLRLIKDKYEINQTKHAIDATLASLDEVMPYFSKAYSEYEIATSLEYWFRMHRCEVAFATIVGAGRSGSILHYNPIEIEYRIGQGSNNIKKNDSILVDCGASWGMYNADISRVFPAGNEFTAVQKEIYQIVLEAQKRAISKVKAGVGIATVYNAAAKILTQGLKDLGVLKGSVSSLLKNGKFKEFFPHGIGHSLGLDVHDISQHRGNNAAVLEAGMIFTIEPGLYFPKKTGNIPACGFRIEDDILVTKDGYENLSKNIPKELKEIEAWHASALE